MFTKADIERYFLAEKNESLLFIFIGAAAIILAIIFFFFIKSNWHKGFSIPLLVIGLLQLVAGFTVYNRSDDDRKRNVYAYDMNIGELKEKELPRMETVIKKFILYHYIEFGLLLIGLVLFFAFMNKTEMQFWKGFGVALAVQAAITLSADYVAAKRAITYTNGLAGFISNTK